MMDKQREIIEARKIVKKFLQGKYSEVIKYVDFTEAIRTTNGWWILEVRFGTEHIQSKTYLRVNPETGVVEYD